VRPVLPAMPNPIRDSVFGGRHRKNEPFASIRLIPPRLMKSAFTNRISFNRF
jgi:hypothetical protein